MTELEDRVPFKLGQPMSEIAFIVKRTGRDRLALRIKAKEGLFTIDARRCSFKRMIEKLTDLPVRAQNLTMWLYLSDCTLMFKRYQGLEGKGAPLYRIIDISTPLTMDEILALPTTDISEVTRRSAFGESENVLQPLTP